MNAYANAGNLLSGFSRSVVDFPHRTALNVDGHDYSYMDLDALAQDVAHNVSKYNPPECPYVAFLAHRSLDAFASVLGILRAGRCYVPLNPAFPKDRLLRMIQAAGIRTIIVAKEGWSRLGELQQDLEQSLTVLYRDEPGQVHREDSKGPFDFHAMDQNSSHSVPPIPSEVDEHSPAYLLFTSGSTGIPKGVAVSHRNALSYMAYATEYFSVRETDRFSQTFDLTFDLSVHDMFVCWGSGACLCCVPERSTMAPAKFIRDQQVSMWFSVPSVVTFMQRMRLLGSGTLPSIRYSLFCGEPLLTSQATAWQAAANRSIIENLYGPTEATIAITQFRVTEESLAGNEFPNGVVPIGRPFTSQAVLVVDEHLHPVARGQNGELCLGGSQVTSGYLNNPTKTREQFIELEGQDGTWYRTGDLVREDDTGCLYYLGRIDNQIQVLGHRVELQEVEHVLRQAGNETAVALGWPTGQAQVESIIGCYCDNTELNAREVIEYCRSRLPDYMVPARIVLVREMPFNSNGKIDRKALSKIVEEKMNGHFSP